jgi:PilZ domain
MKHDKSIFRQPVHAENRSPLKQTCTLHFPDCDCDASTVNISYGGLGIDLTGFSKSSELTALQSVTVADGSKFDVCVAWKKAGRMGLSFKSRKSSMPAVVKLTKRAK